MFIARELVLAVGTKYKVTGPTIVTITPDCGTRVAGLISFTVEQQNQQIEAHEPAVYIYTAEQRGNTCLLHTKLYI